MFGRDKEKKLDEYLREKEKVSVEPSPKKYRLVVVTELESIPTAQSHPEAQATRIAASYGVHGFTTSTGDTLNKYIPPHRIFEILFEEEK